MKQKLFICLYLITVIVSLAIVAKNNPSYSEAMHHLKKMGEVQTDGSVLHYHYQHCLTQKELKYLSVLAKQYQVHI